MGALASDGYVVETPIGSVFMGNRFALQRAGGGCCVSQHPPPVGSRIELSRFRFMSRIRCYPTTRPHRELVVSLSVVWWA